MARNGFQFLDGQLRLPESAQMLDTVRVIDDDALQLFGFGPHADLVGHQR